MAKVYKTASGARDPSGRDLVFEQWYQDNIVEAEGGALEQRVIYRAYAREIAKGIQLGPQGVERMLNQLKVKRSVRQGKPMRLGVGFKVDIVKGHPDDAKGERLTAQLTAPEPWPAKRAAAVMAPKGHALGGASIPLDCVGVIEVGEGEADIASLAVAAEVYEERRRQRAEEGFDAAHDDASDPGAQTRAAACYAYAAAQPEHLTPFVDTTSKSPRTGRLGWFVRDTLVSMWPFGHAWWKPKTDAPDWKRRCMVKAAALLLAAIERHDREAARQALADSQASQMTGV
jgi:hypothetical protein